MRIRANLYDECRCAKTFACEMGRAETRRVSLRAARMILALSPPSLATASFLLLGDLPGGGTSSTATALSDDGMTAVGEGTTAAGTVAFRWTLGTGMRAVARPRRSGTTALHEDRVACSADGRTVVGTHGTERGVVAFRVAPGHDPRSLGDLAGRRFGSAPAGVSGDGGVVVGSAFAPDGSVRGFRWTEAGGMKPLRALPGAISSLVRGISRDGRTIVGSSVLLWGRTRATRWSADGVPALLFPEDKDGTQATAVSADGGTIVGWRMGSDLIQRGWIWRGGQSSVVPDLRRHRAEPTAVSPDGTVVVGHLGVGLDFDAFV